MERKRFIHVQKCSSHRDFLKKFQKENIQFHIVTQRQESFSRGHFFCRFDYSSKKQRGGNHEPVDSILQKSRGKEAHEEPDQSVVVVRKRRGKIAYSPIPG